jgi:hypothetical protein
MVLGLAAMTRSESTENEQKKLSSSCQALVDRLKVTVVVVSAGEDSEMCRLTILLSKWCASATYPHQLSAFPAYIGTEPFNVPFGLLESISRTL